MQHSVLAKRRLLQCCVKKKIIGGVNSVIDPYSKHETVCSFNLHKGDMMCSFTVFLFNVMYVYIYI
jgi:hypothetical protein